MNRQLTAIALVVSAFLVGGCASTNDYKTYSEGQAKIEVAKHKAEEAKWKALASIAQGGDTTAKVAAVMALSAGSNQVQATQLQAPQNEMLQWASILLPNITQMYGIGKNAAVAMRSSDNGARVAESTNNAFVGIAGKIQAPGAVTNTTNTSNVTRTTTTSVGDYSGTSSGNSGRIAGGSITDSTHAPTIVTQPAPVVVTQPAPVIVTQPAPVIVP